MSRKRKVDPTDAMRRAFAWQEDRMMLYRELAKVNEELLADLVAENLKPRNEQVLNQVEKEMKEAGLFHREPRA